MKSFAAEGYAIGIVILLLSVSMTSFTSASNNGNAQITVDAKIANIIKMVNESLLRGYIKALVECGPRATGTYDCEKAAKYIYEQFNGSNLDVRYQDWKSYGNRYNLNFFKSQNVEATQEGTDNSDQETLIFNAHYDSVSVSPGANDDGSGTAAVLAAAYVLSKFEFKHTIKFVTFSGEEQGLLGSRAYANEIYNNNENVLVEFNADMIGYAETRKGGGSFRITGTKDVSWIMDDIKQINEGYGINFSISSSIIAGEKRGGSDYFEFIQYGYNSISFWQSEFNSKYYHTSNDNIEHVNFSYLVNTTKIIVGALAYLADIDNVHPQIKIAAPERGKIYYKGRIEGSTGYRESSLINSMLVCAEVTPGNAPIDRVEFYYDGKLKFTDTELPFQWLLNERSFGHHEIKVVVYDKQGRNTSDKMEIFSINLFKKR